MAFDWWNYYDLAQELVEKYSEEEYYRTAISRSYYSAFCICRNQKGLFFRGQRSHQQVIDAYTTSDYGEDATIGALLEGLKRRREMSDYENSHDITEGDARNAIAETATLFDLFDETYGD